MKELYPEKVFMGFASFSGAGLLRAAAFGHEVFPSALYQGKSQNQG